MSIPLDTPAAPSPETLAPERDPSHSEPRADRAENSAIAGEHHAAAPAAMADDGGAVPQVAPDGDAPLRSRRRRRRRRRPPLGVAAASTGAADADATAGADGDGGHAPADNGEAADRDDASPAADGGGGEVGAAEGGEDGAAQGRPILRLQHRRRRRRRPAAPGLLPGTTEETAGADAAERTTTPAGTAPGQRSFHAPRRQRRQAPLSATAPAATSESAQAGDLIEGAAAPGPSGEPGTRPPRSRNRRRRRPRPDGTTDQAAAGSQQSPEGAGDGAGGDRYRRPRRDSRQRGEGAGGERGGNSAQSAPRGDHRGERGGGRRDGSGSGNRRDRDGRRDGSGRGRRDAPRPVERKLYSIDSVVDRGFEDIEEEGAESRRVHWTIVKRTTADQISRKPLSTVYVLQRDGGSDDSEFPSLGAARDAVHKTIVHPEKLTRSKAEHAAEKAGGKR